MRRSLKPPVKDAILAEDDEVFPVLGRRSKDDEGIDRPAHKAASTCRTSPMQSRRSTRSSLATPD